MGTEGLPAGGCPSGCLVRTSPLAVSQPSHPRRFRAQLSVPAAAAPPVPAPPCPAPAATGTAQGGSWGLSPATFGGPQPLIDVRLIPAPGRSSPAASCKEIFYNQRHANASMGVMSPGTC